MILDIKTYPDKILKQKAKKVDEVNDEIRKLIDDMLETLYVKKGAGLAANQVGELKQIIVVDDSRNGINVKVLINPKILSKKGKEILVEGCLSLPGLELEIKRPAKIEVEYLDRQGRQQKLRASDLLARVICHEADHLKGKMILDRIGLWQMMKIKRRLRLENKLPIQDE